MRVVKGTSVLWWYLIVHLVVTTTLSLLVIGEFADRLNVNEKDNKLNNNGTRKDRT